MNTLKEILLNPAIQFTDPDELQFALKVNENEYIYIQCKDKTIFDEYEGYPVKLIKDIPFIPALTNESSWIVENIDYNDISQSDINDIMDSYDIDKNKYSESDYKQLICEGYFEQYLLMDLETYFNIFCEF